MRVRHFQIIPVALIGLGVCGVYMYTSVYPHLLGWSSAQMKESRLRGNRIIEALEQYKTTQSFYPGTLQELVPTFLADIQNPLCGTRLWHYEVYGGGHQFSLGFQGSDDREPVLWSSDLMFGKSWRVLLAAGPISKPSIIAGGDGIARSRENRA